MATLIVKDIPEELKRAYKADCAKSGISIREAIIKLMEQKTNENL